MRVISGQLDPVGSKTPHLGPLPLLKRRGERARKESVLQCAKAQRTMRTVSAAFHKSKRTSRSFD